MIFEYPIKVAVVDDNPNLLETIKIYLEGNDDFEVEVFTNGGDLLDYMKSNVIHLAIVDVFMEGMEGDVVIEKIKSCSGGVSVIVMTGLTNLIKLTTCYEEGAYDVLLKPFDRTEFMSVINSRKEQLDRWIMAINYHVAKKRRD